MGLLVGFVQVHVFSYAISILVMLFLKFKMYVYCMCIQLVGKILKHETEDMKALHKTNFPVGSSKQVYTHWIYKSNQTCPYKIHTTGPLFSQFMFAVRLFCFFSRTFRSMN